MHDPCLLPGWWGQQAAPVTRPLAVAAAAAVVDCRALCRGSGGRSHVHLRGSGASGGARSQWHLASLGPGLLLHSLSYGAPLPSPSDSFHTASSSPLPRVTSKTQASAPRPCPNVSGCGVPSSGTYPLCSSLYFALFRPAAPKALRLPPPLPSQLMSQPVRGLSVSGILSSFTAPSIWSHPYSFSFLSLFFFFPILSYPVMWRFSCPFGNLKSSAVFGRDSVRIILHVIFFFFLMYLWEKVSSTSYSSAIFFFFFLSFRSIPTAYGSSQSRDQIRAAVASLCHSHGNLGSELFLGR